MIVSGVHVLLCAFTCCFVLVWILFAVTVSCYIWYLVLLLQFCCGSACVVLVLVSFGGFSLMVFGSLV